MDSLKPDDSLQTQQKSQVPTFIHQRSGFIRAISDAGLKPTVVHHNLTPAELYEQVTPSLAPVMFDAL
jgi:hypothetical protein